jgi:hypothetical protein
VALSYAWGEPKLDHHIICDGCIKPVTKTLYEALKSLRKMSQRVFWIDQVCIHQADLTEISQRVRIMTRIYSKARFVYIWLGEHDESTRDALSTARLVIDSLNKGGDGVDGDSILDHPESWPDEESGISVKQALERWTNWAKFYTKSWFSRLWVVQEYVLARDHRIFCGDFEIPKQLFLSGSQAIKSSGSRPQLIASILNSEKAHVSNFLQMMAPRRLRDKPDTALHISLAGKFLCSNLRDRIFGILGLPPDDPKRPLADYSLTQREVYQAFARYFIDTGLGDIVLRFSGRDNANPSLELPSWCPDRSFDQGSRLVPDFHSEAAKSLMARIAVRPENHDLISVDGCFIDVITDLGPILYHDESSKFWPAYANMYVSAKDFMERAMPLRYQAATDSLMLWCRLIETADFSSSDDIDVENFFKFHKEAMKEAQFLEELNLKNQDVTGSLLVDSEDSGSRALEEGEETQRKTKPVLPGVSLDQHESLYERIREPPLLNSFTQLGRWVGTRVCLTQSGYLGLVGQHAQVGDPITIIFGFSSVRVLHKHGDYYQNVGIADLFDLKDEDILSMVSSGPTDIILC